MVEPTCPECGFCYVLGLREDEERHRIFHDEEMSGPKSDMKDGIHVVTINDSLQWKRVVEQVFRVGRRDSPYEFSLFEADEAAKNNPIASLKVIGGRAIAGVLTRERSCEHHTLLDTFTPRGDGLHPASWNDLKPHMRRAIEFIWVQKRHRRKGLLGECLSALSDSVGIPIAEFSHRVPFTPDAYRFWARRGLGTVYLADSDFILPEGWPQSEAIDEAVRLILGQVKT
jgi:hypothetical protein